MRKYSDFFQTLHDEAGPVGHLGRGTHYSVLRAISFQDADGGMINEAQYLDFAVIWDEDHDARVMEPIYKLYCSGHLSSFIMFGERKGMMTAITAPQLRRPSVDFLAEQLRRVCDGMANGDYWTTQIGSLTNSQGIIGDSDANVSLYLSNIKMLWHLGLKKIVHPLSEADQEAERARFLESIFDKSKAS
jgi:hypothetical protein